MGFFFGIYLGFGQDREALERVATAVEQLPAVQVGAREIDLWASRYQDGGSWVLCVIPDGVGMAPARNGKGVSLSSAELSELARHLYGTLRTFSGYTRAIVDWEQDDLVTCADLGEEFDEWLEAGLHGLVVSRAERERLGEQAAQHFQPFEPGYDWIPYRGHINGNHTMNNLVLEPPPGFPDPLPTSPATHPR